MVDAVKFKVGDRVKLVSGPWVNDFTYGTVVPGELHVFNLSEYVAVQFDRHGSYAAGDCHVAQIRWLRRVAPISLTPEGVAAWLLQ